MSLTLTENAAVEVKKIITEQKLGEEVSLRVGVTGGGLVPTPSNLTGLPTGTPGGVVSRSKSRNSKMHGRSLTGRPSSLICP